MCPLRIPSTPSPRVLSRHNIIHSSVPGAEFWSSLITKANFDELDWPLKVRHADSSLKMAHTLSFVIVVVKGGSHHFLCLPPPFSWFPLSSRPSTCRISLNVFISVFPPKLIKADQKVPWLQLVSGNGGSPVLLDTVHHASGLVCEGGGKKEDPDSHVTQLFIALSILCRAPRGTVCVSYTFMFSMFAHCLVHSRDSINVDRMNA